MALMFSIGITLWEWIIFIFVIFNFYYSVESIKIITLINVLYQKINEFFNALLENHEHVSQSIIKKITDFLQLFLSHPKKGFRVLIDSFNELIDDKTLHPGSKSQKMKFNSTDKR